MNCSSARGLLAERHTTRRTLRLRLARANRIPFTMRLWRVIEQFKVEKYVRRERVRREPNAAERLDEVSF